jgi:hypothetical protein
MTTATMSVVLSKSRMRRVFLAAICAYIAINVAVSLIGLLFKLPDLPATQATTDAITVGQVLVSPGTIVSPPLLFMLIAVLLLWGVTSRVTWLSITCTVLIALGAGITAVDEYGGLLLRPIQYSQGKWDLVLVLGSVFIAVAAVVAISGVAWMAMAIARPPTRARTI